MFNITLLTLLTFEKKHTLTRNRETETLIAENAHTKRHSPIPEIQGSGSDYGSGSSKNCKFTLVLLQYRIFDVANDAKIYRYDIDETSHC